MLPYLIAQLYWTCIFLGVDQIFLRLFHYSKKVFFVNVIFYELSIIIATNQLNYIIVYNLFREYYVKIIFFIWLCLWIIYFTLNLFWHSLHNDDNFLLYKFYTKNSQNNAIISLLIRPFPEFYFLIVFIFIRLIQLFAIFHIDCWILYSNGLIVDPSYRKNIHILLTLDSS